VALQGLVPERSVGPAAIVLYGDHVRRGDDKADKLPLHERKSNLSQTRGATPRVQGSDTFGMVFIVPERNVALVTHMYFF
jgi:hypothetical protein